LETTAKYDARSVIGKLKGLSEAESWEIIPETTILLGFRGSIAHGLYVPPSDPNSIDDKDLMGVYIGPREHYIGFPRHRCDKALEYMREPWDIVHYEVRKFFSLLLKQNPNVLGLLWLDETLYKFVDPWGEAIIRRRDWFSSREAYYSFVGYARSQLSRMERFEHHGRMGAKRKALVELHGYDTKNAAHLIRLLRMGIEYLRDGQLRVLRTHDAQELQDIKAGRWDLDRVKEYAADLFDLAETAHQTSPLPPKPDKTRAEGLLMQIVGESLNCG
jgi:predicted nucleotidyltransferase